MRMSYLPHTNNSSQSILTANERKNKQKKSAQQYYDNSGWFFCLFFGKIEDTVICFWDLLTFTKPIREEKVEDPLIIAK